jgi:hypothetical protein
MYPFGGEINGSEEVIGFTEGFMNKYRLDGSAFVCVFAYFCHCEKKNNNSCSEMPVNN